MNAVAQAAIEWTRGRLSAPQRRFLAELPLTRQEDDRLYVHSEASHPARWHYVRDTPDAARSIAATDAHVTFCGHIHRPALYSMSSAAKMTSFVPTSDVPVQLLGGRRWLAVLGSVGQPRDGDPAASFAMFDTDIARDHLLPRALRCRGGGGPDSRQRPAALAGRSPARGEMSNGEAFDRARRGTRRLHHRRVRPPGRHGDAVDGDPSRHQCAAADEGPAGFRGRGSGGHRQLRDGADDRAAAGRPARAGLFRHRRFRPAALCRHGAHPRQDAVQPDRPIAAPL